MKRIHTHTHYIETELERIAQSKLNEMVYYEQCICGLRGEMTEPRGKIKKKKRERCLWMDWQRKCGNGKCYTHEGNKSKLKERKT